MSAEVNEDNMLAMGSSATIGDRELRRLPDGPAGALLPLVMLHNAFRVDLWAFADYISSLKECTLTEAQRLSEWFNFIFVYQLDFHHHHEDVYFFPKYEQLMDKTAAEKFQKLAKDHVLIDKLLNKTSSQLEELSADSLSKENREKLYKELVSTSMLFSKVLSIHLSVEEDFWMTQILTQCTQQQHESLTGPFIPMFYNIPGYVMEELKNNVPCSWGKLDKDFDFFSEISANTTITDPKFNSKQMVKVKDPMAIADLFGFMFANAPLEEIRLFFSTQAPPHMGQYFKLKGAQEYINRAPELYRIVHGAPKKQFPFNYKDSEKLYKYSQGKLDYSTIKPKA